MYGKTKPKKPRETQSCPLCRYPYRLPAGTRDMLGHFTHAHAGMVLPMGDILWLKPPHEAFYLGRLYAVGR